MPRPSRSRGPIRASPSDCTSSSSRAGPLCRQPRIPHIVDARDAFSRARRGPAFGTRSVPAARAELRREIRAQLELFRRTGLPLAHVDGHLHMHLHPMVLHELAELAPEFQIPVIRLPSEELGLALSLGRVPLATRLVWSAVFPLLRRNGIRRLRRAGVAYADRVYGLLATGRLSEEYLVDLLPKISAEWAEVYCHPSIGADEGVANGPSGSGARELAALLSPRVREAIQAGNFLLTSSDEAALTGPQGRPL